MSVVRYRNIYSVILVFFWFSLFIYIAVCVRYRGYLHQENGYEDDDVLRSEIVGALTHEDDEETGYDVIVEQANQKEHELTMAENVVGTTRQRDMGLSGEVMQVNVASLGANIDTLQHDTRMQSGIKLYGRAPAPFQSHLANPLLLNQQPFQRIPNFQQSSAQRPPPLQQIPLYKPPIGPNTIQAGPIPIRHVPLLESAPLPSSNFTTQPGNPGAIPGPAPLARSDAVGGPSRGQLFHSPEGLSRARGFPAPGLSGPSDNSGPEEALDLPAGILSEEQRVYEEGELFKPMALNPKTFSLSITKSMIEHFQVTLPPLLAGYKNPCWLEDLAEDHSYTDSYYNQCNVFPNTDEQRFKAKFELFERNVLRKRAKFGAHWRIRCFPYFFLLGMGKCGTTDLFITMKAYAKDLAPTFLKESHFWEWKRCQHTLHCKGKQRNPSLADYLDALDQPAERVRQEKVYTANGTEYHPLILGDFTPSTLTFNPCWPRQPGNVGREEPRYTTPHYIHRVRPETKFIVILRDPVERIFSNYKMKFRLSSQMHGENAKSFHDEMINATTYLLDCMKTKTERACAYSVMRFDFMTHVSNSMYEIFIRDWLSVFPRDQFLFLRMEDYMENRVPHVKAILKFLDLDELSAEQEVEVTAKQVVNQAPHTSEMYDATRDLLRDFFKPFNSRLAELLGNDGFTWGY